MRDGQGEVRYGELVRRAYRLSRWLVARGVGPEVTVGICLPRSADLVTAELAVMLSGGAFVPLDPEYPRERLAVILADAGASWVVSEGSLKERLPANVELVSMASFRSGEPDSAAPELFAAARVAARQLSPRALAYVIYTSGSTGRPKGVMVEHDALSNFVGWHREAFGLDARSRTTMVYSPGFDSSLAEIWPALTAGSTLVVAPADVRLSPERLVSWLVEEKVTFTDLPTPLVERILGLPWPRGGSLRTMATGGDRLHGRPRAEHPWELFNEYGPTEATVTATSGQVLPAQGDGGEEGLPSIGRPIDGTSAYVLDEHLVPVPAGVEGELYLGGRGIARGYLNQKELTAERFLRDPFAERPEARMYRTGDRARWQADGSLQFCGRADDQVKVRGYRIEPGEIVVALCAHPQVATAHVIAARAPSGDLALVAYVAPKRGGPTVTVEDLRRHASAHLPAFMLPAAYVMLEALPLTSRGKVDARALPPPLWSSERPRDLPRAKTNTERCIAAIWKEILRLPDVGVDDNFFDVGGNSLLLASVHQAIERALNRSLPLLTLFEHPTIRAAATHLDGEPVVNAAPSPSESRIKLPQARRQDGASLMQQRRRGSHNQGGDES